ncbi:MAG: hypothetical protein QM662_15840 [Gordonia sp. (in: high G+C Gram-positive bacteria)]
MRLFVVGPGRGQRISLVLLGVVPALALMACSVVLLWAWHDELPDPVASHWGSGGIDGTTSLAAAYGWVIGAGLVAAAVGVATVCWIGDPVPMRALLAIVNATATITIGVIVVIAAAQRGLADAHDAALPGRQIAGLFVVAALVAALSALAVPTWTPVGRWAAYRSGRRRPSAQLAAGERFHWSRTVAADPIATGIVGVSVMTGLVVSVITRAGVATGIVAVVAAALCLVWPVRVTADRRALTVRGRFGWPRITMPVTDIDHAEVVPVRAIGDFGGYGYRIGVRGDLRGVRAIVLRSGDALLVSRTDGRRTAIVVDDAETAAGLINDSVAERGSAQPG